MSTTPESLRSEIDRILTEGAVDYQELIDSGAGRDQPTTAFRDLHLETIAALLALFQKLERESRIDELGKIGKTVHENNGARAGANIKGFNTAVRYYRENIDDRITQLQQGDKGK